jgi:aspartyl-tRNA(Asn)/glutamyl-tRNA(Gln) amidotransferase subunit C
MIERHEVEKLALLSRIAVPEEELESIGREIATIIEYVSEIQKATVHDDGTPEAGVVRNVMRDDMNPLPDGVFSEVLLAAVPAREGKYVKVKKIL